MKKNKIFKIILSQLLFFCALFIIYYKTDFIQNEGFNPSDEGVVIAQSYRIVNGEIPHKDFVAIRPVFSGILHMIHFISPLPLVESGRWFVLFEYFLIALFFSLMIYQIFLKTKKSKEVLVFLISISTFTFLLNINIYTIFPWTTIDAILFSISGLYLIITGFKNPKYFRFSSIATGLFLLSLSTLCRQSFIIIPGILSLFILIITFKNKLNILRTILIYFIGYLPIFIYILYLYYNDALNLFIQQITGRTELIETGFITFGKNLIKSWLLPFFITVFGFIIYRKIIKATPLLSDPHKKKFYGFTLILTLLLGFTIFFLDFTSFFKVSFELFFIAIIISIFKLTTEKFDTKIFIFLFSIILLAWTSSISLGDNAPIFTTGLLFCFSLCISTSFIFRSKLKLSYLFVPLVLLMIFLSIDKQKRINYRDLSYTALNYRLGDIFENFGNIKTNQNTYNYYKELKEITDSLQKENKTFTIIPNNAIFYPLTGTKNFFPLDWMQRAEYVGNEKYVHEKIINTLKNKIDYIIIEKINSKVMQNELVNLDVFVENYDYMPIIYDQCTKTSYQGDFFTITKIN